MFLKDSSAEKITAFEGIALHDQSIENTGVAFVKGTHERNKFFEKIDNQ